MGVKRTTKGGRRFKGARVTKVTHYKTKREGWVMLDKADMTFWATAGEGDSALYFESKDGREVERWLETNLGKALETDRLEWKPVAKVKIKTNSWREEEDGVEFEIEIDRYWVALTKDRREWRHLPWDACDPESSTMVADLDRFGQSTFHGKGPKHEACLDSTARPSWQTKEKPMVFPHMTGDVSYVWWTPELWAGLNEIIAQVKSARAALKQMLGTKAGLETVTQVGAGKLPLRITATASPATP